MELTPSNTDISSGKIKIKSQISDSARTTTGQYIISDKESKNSIFSSGINAGLYKSPFETSELVQGGVGYAFKQGNLKLGFGVEGTGSQETNAVSTTSSLGFGENVFLRNTQNIKNTSLKEEVYYSSLHTEVGDDIRSGVKLDVLNGNSAKGHFEYETMQFDGLSKTNLNANLNLSGKSSMWVNNNKSVSSGSSYEMEAFGATCKLSNSLSATFAKTKAKYNNKTNYNSEFISANYNLRNYSVGVSHDLENGDFGINGQCEFKF